MKSKRLITFVDRYPLVGPTIWMVSLQYFVIQYIVALAWPVHYSLFSNLISDLGNTACGQYMDRFVCSPLHGQMNASFITLGLTMMAGAVLIYHEARESHGTVVGFSLMALAGLGTVIVGLFPENANVSLHTFGATLAFFVGNVGIIVLGLSLNLRAGLRFYTIFSGLISLGAWAFSTAHLNLGIGEGGMERLISYPQTLWLIVFGIYASRSHYMRVSRRRKK